MLFSKSKSIPHNLLTITTSQGSETQQGKQTQSSWGHSCKRDSQSHCASFPGKIKVLIKL